MKQIQTRSDLIGLNAFGKLFGLTRKEVTRIVERGQVSGIMIKDGDINRVFIDLGAIIKEAKSEDVAINALVRRFCRQSKRG